MLKAQIHNNTNVAAMNVATPTGISATDVGNLNTGIGSLGHPVLRIFRTLDPAFSYHVQKSTIVVYIMSMYVSDKATVIVCILPGSEGCEA